LSKLLDPVRSGKSTLEDATLEAKKKKKNLSMAIPDEDASL
jgi:hypothetical protein